MEADNDHDSEVNEGPPAPSEQKRKEWKRKLPKKKNKKKAFVHFKRQYQKYVKTPITSATSSHDGTISTTPTSSEHAANNEGQVTHEPMVSESRAGTSGASEAMDCTMKDSLAEMNCDSFIEKIAIPTDSFPIDTADDCMVIGSYTPQSSQSFEDNLAATNVMFQSNVIEKIAVPTVVFPTEGVQDLMVIQSAEMPDSSQSIEGSLTESNPDLSSHIAEKSIGTSDSFTGIAEGEIMASEELMSPCSMPETNMSAETEGIYTEHNVHVHPVIYEEIRAKIQSSVPSKHTVLLTKNGIKVGFCSTITEHLVVQRSIYAQFNGDVDIGIHGKNLPPKHDLWRKVVKIPLTPENTDEFIQNVLVMTNELRRLAICRGIEDFKSSWKTIADRSYTDQNPFLEARYKETCKSNDCFFLVPNFSVKRCSNCAKLWRNLFNSTKTRKIIKTPNKFKGDSYCNSPEIKRRLAQQRKAIKKSAEEIARLRQKIDLLLENEGLDVDEDTSDSLLDIVTDDQYSGNLTDIQRLIIQQQIEAARKNSTKGMRWHPAMIRIALSLRMTSAAAYEELRGILHLPSERTLFNYSHFIEATDGINPDIICDVAEELCKSSPKPHQRLHVVSFDEIHIKKNLAFRKSTGEMVGYVKLLPIEEEIAGLEAMMEDEVLQASRPSNCELPMATKMLSYMVTGVCNSIKSVVASYGVANLSAETLDRLTWDVVGALEVNGIEVIALIADGASTNRKFFQSQKAMSEYLTESDTVYCTPNRFNPDRPVFLLNDPPHLLKTTRNCVYSSGINKPHHKKRRYSRLLKKNGQHIVWDTVVRLYEREKHNTARKLFHINQGDVTLNPYSVMNVSSAAHILSQSTADCVRDNGWNDSEEFAILCEKTNAAFEMMNGAYSSEGKRKRNSRLDAYERSDDERFDQLLDFWEYLDGWQKEVAALNIPRVQRHKSLLSYQTTQGWERTIKGFNGAVKYILSVAEKHGDKAYVNARKFSQDDLEHHFGKQRGRLGGNRQPDLNEGLRSTAQMHVQRQLSYQGRKKGNTAVSRSLSLEDLSKPLPKKKSKRNSK